MLNPFSNFKTTPFNKQTVALPVCCGTGVKSSNGGEQSSFSNDVTVEYQTVQSLRCATEPFAKRPVTTLVPVSHKDGLLKSQ